MLSLLRPMLPSVGRFGAKCWVNFLCRGVLPIWIRVGQGPIVLPIRADGGCLDIFFSRLSLLFSFSLSLWETVRYRLKYCLKGPLRPKQPTKIGEFAISSDGYFSLGYHFSLLSPSLWETTRYRLKYCPKEPSTQPTRLPVSDISSFMEPYLNLFSYLLTFLLILRYQCVSFDLF